MSVVCYACVYTGHTDNGVSYDFPLPFLSLCQWPDQAMIGERRTVAPSFTFSPRHDLRWSVDSCDPDMLAQPHVSGDVMRKMATDILTGLI